VGSQTMSLLIWENDSCDGEVYCWWQISHGPSIGVIGEGDFHCALPRR